jgi:hypothetical protein
MTKDYRYMGTGGLKFSGSADYEVTYPINNCLIFIFDISGFTDYCYKFENSMNSKYINPLELVKKLYLKVLDIQELHNECNFIKINTTGDGLILLILDKDNKPLTDFDEALNLILETSNILKNELDKMINSNRLENVGIKFSATIGNIYYLSNSKIKEIAGSFYLGDAINRASRIISSLSEIENCKKIISSLSEIKDCKNILLGIDSIFYQRLNTNNKSFFVKLEIENYIDKKAFYLYKFADGL